MKKILIFIISVCLVFNFVIYAFAGGGGDESQNEVEASAGYRRTVDARSAVLLDAKSGRVLYEQNADEPLPPASVTKTMTMLLVLEALDDGKISLDDTVSVSANAASMGGSQVYLEPGEQMSVDELLKCMIVSSANDAAVALAEYVCGSEAAFVERMNERAGELGCTGTHFENPTGLDDSAENHTMTARDIAKITMEILKHPTVYNYSTIWMDTIRNGAFGLTNTNRLIRFYKGATGLKTGSTAKAKFCISATAERDGLSLIAVIMSAPTRDIRNAAAESLFDFGFANYALFEDEPRTFPGIYVAGGKERVISAVSESFSTVVSKGDKGKIEVITDVPERLTAPVAKGEKIGTVTYKLDGETLGTADVLTENGSERTDFFGLLHEIFSWFLLSPEK